MADQDTANSYIVPTSCHLVLALNYEIDQYCVCLTRYKTIEALCCAQLHAKIQASYYAHHATGHTVTLVAVACFWSP
jgi:hypothetical protein